MWLADLNKCSTKIIRNKISAAVETNRDKSFAVSSKFLGEILGENPNTLSKRIQRVLDEIKNSSDENGTY